MPTVTNVLGESIFSATMWHIVNQLGKHGFSCREVVNNLKERKPLVTKLIEIVLNQFLLGATGTVPRCRI